MRGCILQLLPQKAVSCKAFIDVVGALQACCSAMDAARPASIIAALHSRKELPYPIFAFRLPHLWRAAIVISCLLLSCASSYTGINRRRRRKGSQCCPPWAFRKEF